MRLSVVLVLALATLASSHVSSAQPAPIFTNGMAQVVPAFQDSTKWIRQRLRVETDLDTDRDGRKDRVHVDSTRPVQTETDGLTVAVVYGSSPYFAGTSRGNTFWDVK